MSETFEKIRRIGMWLNLKKYIYIRVSAGKYLDFIMSERGMEANPRRFKQYNKSCPQKCERSVEAIRTYWHIW